MALARLTEEQQTVILLRFEEGWTSAQIAQVLGKTETAVKALQRRGLAALARQLSPETHSQNVRS
jgi:RNA polymerase sigma-70 factor (ECF subfamily)